MTKNELRQIYFARQKSLSTRERNEKSQLIAEQFFTNFTLETCKNLHLFLPIEKNGEIETRFIYDRIWREFPQIRTFVPRVRGEILEHLEFAQKTKLVENSWQILEPLGNDLAAEKIFDVILIPLLCFDKKGFRVGYGKGFYDKFLKKCRTDCLKIGVSFFAPIEEVSDINQFDVRLDYCLTPNQIWKF
jgi:5-formyltetrahydrofolate cyclo-ligase